MYSVQRGSNKYGNVSQTYNGYSYMSKKEANYAFELDMRKKAKDIRDWERQVKIDLRVNDHHICNYYMDFLIHHNDGSLEYVEVKGFETDVWRLKWKLTEAIFSKEKPDAKLTLVK